MNRGNEGRIITNPVRAIRAKCLDCCCGQANEVSLCPVKGCALYPFRFGKNPYRKEATEKQLEAARKTINRINQARKNVGAVK